jgi:quercetin dioxygenase-like cupin family protein
MTGAEVFRFDGIDWADEMQGTATTAPPPGSLVAAAQKLGARRKRMVRGENGFFMNHSELPPGFEVPPHQHDHDELLVVVEGGCTLDGTTTLGPNDAVVITGGHTYGFVCGPEGMRLLTIRTGEASTFLADS